MTSLVVGCGESPTTPGRLSQQALRRRAGEALLNSAATQLADLPSAIDTELRPPAVILDASQSANRADVLAVCTPSPSDPSGPINLITVPTQNSRFRSLGVRSGDLLKYFIMEDETVDEERRQAGLGARLALEFTVAQVLGENALLLEKGVPSAVVRNYMEPLVDEGMRQDPNLPLGILVPAKIEIWRNLDDRLIEINAKLGLYAERRLPRIGWQPSPDEQVLTQIVTWLNQWLRQSDPKTNWQLEPMLKSLGAELTGDEALAPFISNETLSAAAFRPEDGRMLQEAVWHRDISRWAQGADFNDVARASALFDWTVRNIQLVADEEGAAHRPWEVLLFGRGTAEQRAWVFAMLGRQQGLDIVMLRAESGEPGAEGQQSSGPESSANRSHPYWLAALLVDAQLYLFDMRLGLPIPGPGGEGVATLEQARNEDAVLRRLDLEDAPYPLTAIALNEVVPHVVAEPFSLTRRAMQVEAKLTGDDRVALSTRPRELAERLKAVTGLAKAELWELPFRTLRDQLTRGRAARRREALAFEPFAVRPLLWKARTRHFQGRRPVVEESQGDQVIDDHREAAQLYTNRSVRPSDREIAQTESADERRIATMTKLDAAYWVGLLSFDDERLDVAAHWLGRPELVAAESHWSAGARYNLARTYEAQGKLNEAIELLQENDMSDQDNGNRLRAARLKARAHENSESKSSG